MIDTYAAPRHKVSFPHFGDYCIPFEHIITRGMEMNYVIPPPMTKRTLELGSKYSPDSVCAPFKYTLGSMIEALESGADLLVETGGECRLGYYGELQEQILRDLGYEFEFVNLARADYSKPVTLIPECKKINPHFSVKKLAAAGLAAVKMMDCMDAADDFIRKNIGFELENGAFEAVHAAFLKELREAQSRKDVEQAYRVCMEKMKSIPVNKPKKPLRVGVVGEYDTIMDPFSNHHIEREMAKMGMVIERWMNLSGNLLREPQKKVREKIRRYSKYNMGTTSMSTIDCALACAKKGYDGIIHLKSFGCTPEIDAMPVLQNISRDYKIPILYFSFDSQTGDEGIMTRLEAFYDMMVMRKGTR